MQPTLQQVFDLTRSHLGDIQVSGGAVFTNAVLQNYFGMAWRELYQALALTGSPRIVRYFYYVLPALTQTFSPAAFGLTDFAEPEYVEERGNFLSHNIVSTSNATPIVVNDPAHGYASGQEIYLDGIVGTRAPWGRWNIAVIDANNYSLNGSGSDGSAGTGGQVSTGTDEFGEVQNVQEQDDSTPVSSLQYYLWENQTLQFRGATEPRQLRITYLASGVATTNPSATLGLDDCDTFLAARVGGLAAHAKGWYQMSTDLKNEALGPRGVADGSGGLLYIWLATQIRTMQRGQFRRRQYRERRYNEDILFSR